MNVTGGWGKRCSRGRFSSGLHVDIALSAEVTFWFILPGLSSSAEGLSDEFYVFSAHSR